MGLFPSFDFRERTPPKGIARYFQLLWDNLGKLLLANLLCFAGFLPLALLLSLGLIYENFWISAFGGMAGGTIAGAVWTAQLSLCFLCVQTSPYRWFEFWRQTLRKKWIPAAIQGAVFGGSLGALLSAASFFLQLGRQGTLPLFVVWIFLGVDFFLWSLAANGMFSVLCHEDAPASRRLRSCLRLMAALPVRSLIAAGASLCCLMLGIALFPVSVPYALLLGFSPLALLMAQLFSPALTGTFHQTELAADASFRSRQRAFSSFLQTFRIPLLIGFFLCAIVLGFWQITLRTRQPDLQVAVVHREALPDSVREALEDSLAGLVGDCNNDGAAYVIVNDYTVVFDGSATNTDLQTAGMTQLVTDLSGKVSSIYIVEDASAFDTWYSDHVTLGGLWQDSAILSSIDAGSYSPLWDLNSSRSGQELLAPFAVFQANWMDPQFASLIP